MYLSHFGLKEAPFRITPHTEFFFSGANRGPTLEALLYAIAHDEGIVKVTGEVGSGKTMLCRVLVERLPKNVETIYLANPSLTRDEILHVIAADLHLEFQGERLTILLRALQERLIKLYAQGRRVVVLIDEAHAMPLETLEEVRLLSNLESNRHKLLQIVLFGQPELDAHLSLPHMRQLKERITHSFRLEPLMRADVESYIEFRMRAAGYRGPNVFGAQAMRLIARASEGLTRRVNILADKSLLAAFAGGTHHITAKHVRAAVRDSEYTSSRRLSSKWWLLAGGLAAGLAIGLGVHILNQVQAVRPGTATSEAAMPLPNAGGSTPSSGASAEAAQAVVPRTNAADPPSAHASPVGLGTTVSAFPAPSQRQAGAQAVVQLEAAPTAQTATAETVAMGATTTLNALSTATAPEPPADGRLAQQRFSATQQWLKTARGGSWTIQLLTVSEDKTGAMERFLEQAAKLVPLDEIHVYSVKMNGRQHYGITYGNYPTLEDTITAMGDLPSSFKSRGPFHRSIATMRQQNQE